VQTTHQPTDRSGGYGGDDDLYATGALSREKVKVNSMTALLTNRAAGGGPSLGIEYASRDEITALQIERTKNTLRHVYYNVPHYRNAFDDLGVHPDDFHEMADLAKFPMTEKEDLRRNYPFGMFAVPQEQVARVHASSGTTGLPTVVGPPIPSPVMLNVRSVAPTPSGVTASWST
jgi:hypothetical protein